MTTIAAFPLTPFRRGRPRLGRGARWAAKRVAISGELCLNSRVAPHRRDALRGRGAEAGCRHRRLKTTLADFASQDCSRMPCFYYRIAWPLVSGISLTFSADIGCHGAG